MNIFRFVADMLHLFSYIILIWKVRGTNNCLGLSYKTQEIYLVVFLSRYWDLFLYFISAYNTTLKILFILCTIYIILMMRVIRPYRFSYDKESDSFPHYYIYLIAYSLTLFAHSDVTPFELSWSFSIWLESVAIIPQLYMLRQIKEVENLTGNYVGALGLYRFFYLLSWAQKYYSEEHIYWISIFGGVTQTVIYGDFLYYYIKSKKTGCQVQADIQFISDTPKEGSGLQLVGLNKNSQNEQLIVSTESSIETNDVPQA